MSTGLKTLKLYVSYWRRRPWLAASSFLVGPAFVLQNILSALFIAQALGQLSEHNRVNASTVWFAILSLLGGILLWFFSDRYFAARLHVQTMRDMYNDCFERLFQHEYNFFANNFGGSLVTQANRFVKAYELLHAAIFLQALGPFCGVLIALGVILYYNAAIGLAVTVLWLISIFIVVYLGIKRMPIRRAAVAKESIQTGELADAVTNAVTIKTFATEEAEFLRYDKINKARAGLFAKSWDIAIRNNLLLQSLSAVLQLVILLGGIRAIQTGSIGIATFLLFQVYIMRIIDSISTAGLFVRQLEGILGDAHEMTELFGRQPEVQDPDEPEETNIQDGHVIFDNVHFRYADQGSGSSLFASLSIDIKPGERIGLVGPSGGGKTTITRLLLRFHDIDSGAITIDGQNIASIRQGDLHRYIAYVSQEPILFHRSLSENIGYGKPDAYPAEIVDAAKKAHAHDFIKELPSGYDTLVGERGIKLSGGQRQRVAIARAILKDAPILLLDEATSALDSESEKLIQDALWKLMKDRTAIVIAHRLSTIQRMDRIIVLDQGKIIEEGTHRELLRKNGKYAELWAHQSGGFLEE